MRVGFVELLTVLFVTLKLTNVIDWAWIWVLSPLWICLGLWVIAMIVAILLAVVAIC